MERSALSYRRALAARVYRAAIVSAAVRERPFFAGGYERGGAVPEFVPLWPALKVEKTLAWMRFNRFLR